LFKLLLENPSAPSLLTRRCSLELPPAPPPLLVEGDVDGVRVVLGSTTAGPLIESFFKVVAAVAFAGGAAAVVEKEDSAMTIISLSFVVVLLKS
jgi:hypothetical protein